MTVQADPSVVACFADGHEPTVTRLSQGNPLSREPNELDGLPQAVRSRPLRRVSSAGSLFPDCMRVKNVYQPLAHFLGVLGKDEGRGRLQVQTSPKEHLTRSTERRHTLINERGIAMTLHDQGTSWFLAQLKPNCGHIAERNLKLQEFQTFLPTEDGMKRVRGKFVTAPRPLFPGYIFVQIDTGAGNWRTINSTHGITRLVSFGKEPAPVPLYIVSQLMLRCDATGKLLPPEHLKPGDQVRLTSGPFADFVGRIEALAPARRVWVLMEIMGSETRVAVAADQLRMA